jgi:tetratricopeptide (TPR) repeat protein
MDVREYTAKFPKRARKEYEKGVESDRAGKRDEAVQHYQKALQVSPDFYYARNNLGSDYLSKSDFVRAREEFEQAVRLNQSDAGAYFNLSNVCMLTAQLPDARRYLEEGMRRQPDSALGHFLLGSLNLREGRLPEAERALRQAEQLDPVMVQPRLQLVNLFLQQGRKKEAVGELHAFMTTFPDNSFNKQARDLLHRLETPSNATAPRQ